MTTTVPTSEAVSTGTSYWSIIVGVVAALVFAVAVILIITSRRKGTTKKS
jgi:hypothetical protein